VILALEGKEEDVEEDLKTTIVVFDSHPLVRMFKQSIEEDCFFAKLLPIIEY